MPWGIEETVAQGAGIGMEKTPGRLVGFADMKR